MTQNPYQPPNVDVSRPANVKGSLVKAVIAGVLTDILGTVVVSFIGALGFGFYLVMQGMTPDQLERYLAGVSPMSAFSVAFTVLGMLMSVVAGYVCARIARHREYTSALMVGVLSSLVGLLFSFGYYPFWLSLVSVMTTLAAVLIGAWLVVRRKQIAMPDSA